MQHSLLRRRVAIRACFDALLEYRLIPSPSSNITLNDVRSSLLASHPFVVIKFFRSPIISFDFRVRITVPVPIIAHVISTSNLPNMHKQELLNVTILC